MLEYCELCSNVLMTKEELESGLCKFHIDKFKMMEPKSRLYRRRNRTGGERIYRGK